MTELFEKIAEFNRVCGAMLKDKPSVPTTYELYQYRAFDLEETEELEVAYQNNDVVEVFDALLDKLYFLVGFAVKQGFTPELLVKGLEEVHRSNMSKFATTEEHAIETCMVKYQMEDVYFKQVNDKYVIIRKSDGKVLKAIGFQHPDLKNILLK